MLGGAFPWERNLFSSGKKGEKGGRGLPSHWGKGKGKRPAEKGNRVAERGKTFPSLRRRGNPSFPGKKGRDEMKDEIYLPSLNGRRGGEKKLIFEERNYWK